MEGTEDDNPDAEYDKRQGRGKEDRRKIFYKQSAIRDRRDSKSRTWTLDGRELPLAPGCNLPRGWEPYIGETGVL